MYNPKDYFNQEQIVQIQKLGISIANNIIPLHLKDHYYMNNGRIWDIDTYCMGACKCLTMTETDFFSYYVSKRNDYNTMGNLDLIQRICYQFKVMSFLRLQQIKDFGDEIIICEAGRGTDVILASLIKPWRRIVAYDQDKSVLYEMQKYFKGEIGLPFETQQIWTMNYNFAGINEKTVIFATCHNIQQDKKDEILANKNILAVIDGQVLI